jgi:hypothetical protein
MLFKIINPVLNRRVANAIDNPVNNVIDFLDRKFDLIIRNMAFICFGQKWLEITSPFV